MVSVAVLVMVEAEGRGVMCVNILPLANTSGFTKVTCFETETENKRESLERADLTKYTHLTVQLGVCRHL